MTAREHVMVGCELLIVGELLFGAGAIEVSRGLIARRQIDREAFRNRTEF